MKTIDVLIWTVLALTLDFILGRYGLFGIRTYLAPSLALLILLLRRWDAWGFIGVLSVMILHLFLYDAGFAQRAANALSYLALFLTFRILRTQPFRTQRVGYGWVFLLYLATYLLMFLSESLFALLFGVLTDFATAAINHLINLFLGLGLISLIDAQNGLFQNMTRYLLDTARKGTDE